MEVALQGISHLTPEGREYVIQRNTRGQWRAVLRTDVTWEGPWVENREAAVAWAEGMDGKLDLK